MGSMDIMDIIWYHGHIFIISALVSQLLVYQLNFQAAWSLRFNSCLETLWAPPNAAHRTELQLPELCVLGCGSSYMWDSSDPVVFHVDATQVFEGILWMGLDQSRWYFSLVQIWIPHSRIWIHGNFRFFKYEPLPQSMRPERDASKSQDVNQEILSRNIKKKSENFQVVWMFPKMAVPPNHPF